MKIARRLQFSFGLLLAIVVALGAFGAVAMRRTGGKVSDALQAAFNASDAVQTLRAEITQDHKLVTLHAAAGTIPDKVQFSGTAQPLADLKTLEPATEQAFTPKVEDLQKKAKALLDASSNQDWQRVGALSRGFDEAATAVEKELEALQTERRAQVLEQIARSKTEALTFAIVFLLSVVVGVAAVGALFASVRQKLLQPLALLSRTARRVSAERDLTIQVPVGGDEEIQDLSHAFDGMMDTLRNITVEMRAATDRLLESALHLGDATAVHGETIARQASALEEARRTSSVLRDSSRSAANQAEDVLRVAEKAEELGRDGESAMTASLSGVQTMQEQTRQVVERIARLASSAQRIGDITATVKDLADQSNVLALNAAIEASRAGEAGVGFGVVAREIRTLADRSIRATAEVRTVLAEVLGGIRESAALVEAANAGLDDGAARTRRLGESLSGLSGIVRENLGAVREIAGAVAGQDGGIGQISNAVDDLARMMEDTVKSVNTTGEAAGVLREVSEQVSSAVKAFRV